ncbi:MAG: low temperature requirement protein A [Herpetosiphonaceae bacterium]|nr:low temperature requirement protein A [Herpetosiphonaceae bacterium]
MVAKRRWWQVPRLRTNEEDRYERRTGWQELFFDLVFVVIVSELAHYLAGHTTLAGIGSYIVLFVPVWWVWIGGTIYNDRFETYDISYRFFVFLQMLPVAAMAIFVHDGLATNSRGFALAYAVVRILLISMWLRGGYHDARYRPVTTRYALGFSCSVLLFIASVFVPAPWRYGLWGLGAMFDLLTPITTLQLQARLPALNSSNLPERFATFVLIVLGEAVVGVVQGIAGLSTLTPSLALTGTLGMALVFGLCWIYFDFVARRRPRHNVWAQVVWTYLHLPLVMTTAALGAAVVNVLSAGNDLPALASRYLFNDAVGVALIAIGLLELTLRAEADEPTWAPVSVGLKLGAGLVAIIIGLMALPVRSIVSLLLLILLVAIQMVYGAYVWYRPTQHRDVILEA